MDIALLPMFRGCGVGTHLLKQTIAQAETRNVSVTIHVERNNPAYNLYQRLGFHKIGEHGIYHLLERVPKGANSPSEQTYD